MNLQIARFISDLWFLDPNYNNIQIIKRSVVELFKNTAITGFTIKNENIQSEFGRKIIAKLVNDKPHINIIHLYDIEMNNRNIEYITNLLKQSNNLKAVKITCEHHISELLLNVFIDVPINNFEISIMFRSLANKLNNNHITSISNIIEKNNFITTLSLKDCISTIYQLKCITDALKINKKITILNLNSHFAELDIYKYIGDLLIKNNTITTLNVSLNSCNPLGDPLGNKIGEYLAYALKVNTTLEIIIIENQHFMNTIDAKYICSGLKKNKSLHTIILNSLDARKVPQYIYYLLFINPYITYMEFTGKTKKHEKLLARNKHNWAQKNIMLSEICEENKDNNCNIDKRNKRYYIEDMRTYGEAIKYNVKALKYIPSNRITTKLLRLANPLGNPLGNPKGNTI